MKSFHSNLIEFSAVGVAFVSIQILIEFLAP